MTVPGLFLTHVWSDRIERHLSRLRRETRDQVSWHLIQDVGAGDLCCETLSSPPAQSVLPIRYGRMLTNNGPLGGFVDAVIWPWLLALDSEFSWFMEYDVDFSGNWANFFRQFHSNKADLLTSTIVPKSQSVDWWWWNSASAPPGVLPDQMHRGFHPIIRVSGRLAHDYRHMMADERWGGHCEFTLPTAAISANLGVEDLGGSGPYCPEPRRNRNYRNTPPNHGLSPGTHVWRPIRDHYFGDHPESFPDNDLLYHPVKPVAAVNEHPTGPSK